MVTLWKVIMKYVSEESKTKQKQNTMHQYITVWLNWKSIFSSLFLSFSPSFSWLALIFIKTSLSGPRLKPFPPYLEIWCSVGCVSNLLTRENRSIPLESLLSKVCIKKMNKTVCVNLSRKSIWILTFKNRHILFICVCFQQFS